MRLLHIAHDGSLTLEEFNTGWEEVPPYAVLSHTWEDTDVVYRDLNNLGCIRNIHAIEEAGWEKIRFCAKQMEQHGPNYFWIGICCVDHASSSEVNEAIDATSNRLKNAQKCYVLLSDMESRSLEGDGESAFRKSKWFTCCWTLQELSMPPSVEFYSREGIRLGDRQSLKNAILKATGISIDTTIDISSWREQRNKDCEGNSVYCLLGQYGCSKPVIPGEDKERTFERLLSTMQKKELLGKSHRWLSRSDRYTNHDKAHKQREAGNSLWMLDAPEYKKWRDSASSSPLWIRGMPGPGKATLIPVSLRAVQRKLRHDERFAKWRDDVALMQEIDKSLPYVLYKGIEDVELYLTELSKCLTRAELRESLATFPPGNAHIYDLMLSSINQGHVRYLTRILTWVVSSMRPLSIEEIAEVVAIDQASDANIDPAFSTPESLEDTLLAQDFFGLDGYSRKEPKQTIILAKDSFKEYLVSDRIKQGVAYRYSLEHDKCHYTIAKNCLEYLMQFEQPLSEDMVKTSALAAYAAKFWSRHFEKTQEKAKDVTQLAMSLLSRENPSFFTWIRLYDPDAPLDGPNLGRSLDSIATPLYYAALLGLGKITTLLLEQGASVNVWGGKYGTALRAAAVQGHLDVVQILLQGAGVDAQGDYYASAIQAAKEYGNDTVADLILQFTQATARLKIAPSDSGYASQRQVDSLHSPSIPDPGIQQNFRAENQILNQTPICCNEDAYLDDIRSIQSDNDSIGSKVLTTRSRAELFAVKHLAAFFAQKEDLRPLHESILQKIEKKRFVPNYRRVLKSYYRRLLNEAASEAEKAVTRVLRSRRNRESIAEGIADQLEFVEENEQTSLEKDLAQPAERQYLEDWLRRMQSTDYEQSPGADQEPLIDDCRSQSSDGDSGFDTESGADAEDDFANIEGAEKFLQQGLAFHKLVLDIRLLMLPHHLRQIVETTPNSSFQFIENNNKNWVNDTKVFLESYTGYRWDWWPLNPRIPSLSVGEQCIQWKLSKRTLYTKITQEQAENLHEIMNLAADHPQRRHCCVAKPRTGWHIKLKYIFRTILKSFENNRQRSAASGNTSSRAAMAYTPTVSNASGASSSATPLDLHGAKASGVTLTNNSNNGSRNTIQVQSRTPTIPAPIPPKAPTRIIFGVQGMRRSLEIEQIEICDQMNDRRFFQELKTRYNKHRWSFQRLLSPFRFQHCNFVKFEKLNINRVFSFGEGLPELDGFVDDYDYKPKPPQGKIPLIEPDLFAVCLQSCDDECKWSVFGPWLHDCFQLPPLCDSITCIPKKKSEFPVQCKQIIRDTAWGIEAECTLSVWMLCVYHLVPLLSSFGFWIYWLMRHPGDWQNASVPTITIIALFAFFWVPFGFIFNSHKPVKYR